MKQAGRSSLHWVVVMVAVVAVAVYFSFDPSRYTWMPKCLFHQITGLQCSGCGSQRALHALLHGDIAEAFSHNALFVISLPVLALLGYSEMNRLRSPRLYAGLHSPAFIISAGVVIVTWGVFRNMI